MLQAQKLEFVRKKKDKTHLIISPWITDSPFEFVVGCESATTDKTSFF